MTISFVRIQTDMRKLQDKNRKKDINNKAKMLGEKIVSSFIIQAIKFKVNQVSITIFLKNRF